MTRQEDLAYEIVRLAAHPALTDRRRQDLDAAVAQRPSWPDVVRLASFHRVAPLLDAHLSDHLPPKLGGALRAEVRRWAVHVLFLSTEMSAIARSFAAAGVPFLVMKGPSMAEAYGSTARRPYVDNDILIRRTDFPQVERLLLNAGFSERKQSDRQQAGYLHVHGEYTFGRVVGTQPSTVDVHTRLLPVGFAFDGPFDALVRRSRPVDIAGTGVPVLGWTDLFLTLAVNALKDQWNRLRLASDFAAVGGMIDDWDELLDRAARGQCLRATHVAVLVSEAEVGAAYPPRVLDSARADRRAVYLAGKVRVRLRHVHEQDVMGEWDRMLFNAIAPDGLRGQLRYLGYVAFRRMTEFYVRPQNEEPAAE